MDIKSNPFYILEVSTEDNKRKIMDAAEEKLLFMDSEIVEKAKSQLLDGRKRLDAELSWFISIPSNMNAEIIKAIQQESYDDYTLSYLSQYNQINYLLEIVKTCNFESIKQTSAFGNSAYRISTLFEDCADIYSEQFDELLYTINTSRLEADIPAINENDLIEQLDVRRNEITTILKNVIKNLPSINIIDSMCLIARNSTSNGKERASMLIESLLEVYEIEIQSFIDKQKNKIYQEANKITTRDSKVFQTGELKSITNNLIEYTHLWTRVIKPLQIISLSKGVEHTDSIKILHEIRSSSLTLNNEFNIPNASLSLLEGIQSFNVCEYLNSYKDVLRNDVITLKGIIKDQIEAKRQQEKEEQEFNEWVNSIFYETEIGRIFKDKLIISVDGINWKDKNTPLEQISGLSWGATKKYVNGIPTGTDYSVTLYTEANLIQINPTQRQQYETIIDKIWRAVAVPIYYKILKRLHDGEILSIGTIRFNDNGVYLQKSSWFSSGEKFFRWSDNLKIFSDNGALIIKGDNDNYEASASYSGNENTHIFDFILKQFYKSNRNKQVLSSLLGNVYEETSKEKYNENQKAYEKTGICAIVAVPDAIMYSNPPSDWKRVAFLKKGDKLKFIEQKIIEGKSWIHVINKDGKSGWVMHELVDIHT